MATIGMTHDHSATAAPVLRTRRMAGQVMLASGVLSSLLYAAADVLGGMRYPGYSFSSQAVSELMASGAPSEGLVDPIFLAYDVFALIFGVALFREARGNRALRITAALLIGYAALGVTGPTLFPMHPRGSAGLAADRPHIVLTGVLVALLLLAMCFGAFALGKRFRAYSFATLLTVIVFGTLTAPYAPRLAAGQPTPGMGVLERINIYAALLWLLTLAIAVWRRPQGAALPSDDGDTGTRSTRRMS